MRSFLTRRGVGLVLIVVLAGCRNSTRPSWLSWSNPFKRSTPSAPLASGVAVKPSVTVGSPVTPAPGAGYQLPGAAPPAVYPTASAANSYRTPTGQLNSWQPNAATTSGYTQPPSSGQYAMPQRGAYGASNPHPTASASTHLGTTPRTASTAPLSRFPHQPATNGANLQGLPARSQPARNANNYYYQQGVSPAGSTANPVRPAAKYGYQPDRYSAQPTAAPNSGPSGYGGTAPYSSTLDNRFSNGRTNGSNAGLGNGSIYASRTGSSIPSYQAVPSTASAPSTTYRGTPPLNAANQFTPSHTAGMDYTRNAAAPNATPLKSPYPPQGSPSPSFTQPVGDPDNPYLPGSTRPLQRSPQPPTTTGTLPATQSGLPATTHGSYYQQQPGSSYRY